MARSVVVASLFLLLTTSALTLPGFAAGSLAAEEAAAPTAAADGTLTLDFEDVDIRNLVRFMAESTGRNFIVDSKVTGKVTLISPKPVNADEALSIFESLLTASGYAIVPAGKVWRILPLADAGKTTVDVLGEKSIGRPGQIVTRLINLHHVSANTIIPVLKPLLSDQATLSAYLPTNTLVVTEAYGNVERIERLVAQLDSGQDNASRSVDTVYLKNAEAKSVAAVLTTMVQNAGQQNSANTLTSFRGPISVVADENTNTLLISAEPSDMNTLKEIITRLDIRRLQVYIEALIMEVSSDLADQFGVEWRSAANLSGTSGVSPFGGQSFGTGGINALAENPLSLPGGFAFGVAGSNITFRGQEYANIGFLLRALRSDSNVNILSTPQLLTLDNEEAEIIVGDNVPFITGTFTPDGNNQNPFQTIQRQDVGLTMRIRPQISENGFIRLNLYQEISSLATTAQTDAADIITRKRSIRTTVMVPDQQMIALGGLIRDDVTQANSQIPCLASIFGAGELFKNTSVQNTKTNLMVFIKPQIINAYGDMDGISKKKYQQMRQLQVTPPRGKSLMVPYPVQDELDMVPEDMRETQPVSPTDEVPTPEESSNEEGAAADDEHQKSEAAGHFFATSPAREPLEE